MRCVLLLLATFIFSACDKTPPAQGQALRVGMSMNYPPFEMRDELGEPAGVSVDLAHALGTSLGRPVTFENMPFDGLMPALKTGRIDVVISSMSATDDRRQSIDFSEPYLRTGLCLLVGAKTDIQSAANLDRPGRKVAVLKATTGHLWAADHLKQADLLVLGEESVAALEVSQGKADAFIYDQMSVLRNWLARPDATRALLKPFREESWAIALRKGDDELRGKVNAFLTEFRGSGGFDRLGGKWLGGQKAQFSKLGVPFVF